MAPIQFGILQIPFQLIDVVGPLDVLSCSSKPYLTIVEAAGVAPAIAAKGIEIEFHWIGLDLAEPSTHTANGRFVATTTVDTCPKLDYLLIGGPDPTVISNLDPRFLKFMVDRVPELKGIFTTCSGGMVVAATGLLDGLEATTNHMAIPMAKEMFPKVKWTGEKQWVVEGKFWTAGGACAGMDMFAHWIMENYGRDVAEAGFEMLDYEPRGLDRKKVVLSKHGGLPA